MFKKIVSAAVLSIAAASSLSAMTIIDNPTESIINITISSKDVNRIVLPTNILDVAYSKEKGMDIKISGNQAFIKFLPIQKEKVRVLAKDRVERVGEPEILYDKAQPSEIFFITENKTYSFAINPDDKIDAETIIVNDFNADKKEILAYETDDVYMATMSKITEQILKNGTPQGYKVKEVKKVVDKNKETLTKLLNLYSGVIYEAELYEIENMTNKPIILNPRDYIPYAQRTPRAISIYYDNQVNQLLPFNKARVVIITKAEK